MRPLRRYSLTGGLDIGRGGVRTLSFWQPKISEFIRYASVQPYFDQPSRSGMTNRHCKFTSSQSLPAGLVSVREGSLLVGSVQLPTVQAGKPVDLDLEGDAKLRYQKAVKQTGQEKNARGQVVVTRQANVPADGRASLTFKLKIIN